MTADDGTAAVHVTLAGAVQPDAAGGVGDPLVRHVVTLDLTSPALRDRLARWSYDGFWAGRTPEWRDQHFAIDRMDRHYAFADALLAELGRGAG